MFSLNPALLADAQRCNARLRDGADTFNPASGPQPAQRVQFLRAVRDCQREGATVARVAARLGRAERSVSMRFWREAELGYITVNLVPGRTRAGAVLDLRCATLTRAGWDMIGGDA